MGLERALDHRTCPGGKLYEAPELAVEVLCPGKDNELRDRETKLELYSRYGSLEYWVVDWHARHVEVYRTDGAKLVTAGVLRGDEVIESPLLPGFSCEIEALFVTVPLSESDL